jgi:hypothetical protein
MQKKDLVSLFMESPFYFELPPRERLFLLQDHRRRFGGFGAGGPPDAAAAPGPPAPVRAPLPAAPQLKRGDP